MKKNSVSAQNLGSFPSPGAPNYRGKCRGSQKGWSSERVPQAVGSIRNAAGFTPFLNVSGRTVPSKWDEAERWICSPVSAYANNTITSHPHLFQRRPKSKSGPIVANLSSTPVLQGSGSNNLIVGSPFTAGVLAPHSVSVVHYDHSLNGVRYSCPKLLVPLSSAPSWSELLYEPSSPNSLEEKDDITKNEDTRTSLGLKCDKGTQMSLEVENDGLSSPKSPPTSVMDPVISYNYAKLEVRDVQVDTQATVIRLSKGHGTKMGKKDLLRTKDDLTETNATEAQASCRDLADSIKITSKLQREEAKITAWENLQKAKAEAAIRKLEMKLEENRSSSMDKILNKLRRAHRKAEKMRSSVTVKQGQHEASMVCSSPRFRYAQICSCFCFHAP